MKTLILVLLFAILIVPINAQSTNSLIFGNALVKYKNMQKTGAVISVIGGVTFFAGNIMYWKVYNDYGNSEPPEDLVNKYGHVMLGGLGLMAVGIPLWAYGKVKERHIEVGLVKFKGSPLVNGIGVKIRF